MLEPNPIFLLYIRERTRDRQTDRQREREYNQFLWPRFEVFSVCVCVCTETAENVRNMGRDSGHSENNNGFGSLEPHLFFP